MMTRKQSLQGSGSSPRSSKAVASVYLRVIHPFFDRQTFGGIWKRLKRYPQLESLSLDENRDLQWRALHRILEHAYDSTDFYRRRFDEAGVRPSQITSSADLKKIPPLTRDDIREHQADLQSRRYRSEELWRAATGGTTDTPVPLFRDPECVRERMAVQLRFNEWAGFLEGDKVFYLWGARQDYIENPSWRRRLYERNLMRRVYAPTSLFNSAVLESYRQTMNDFKPRIVYAYPTPLALFCEFLREGKRTHWRPSSAICIAEPLLEHQRKVIEEVLECPVFEHYGSREFGVIAGECERHTGMHLNPAAAYVELVPVQGAEVEGLQEILVTDLLNYGMPMIRYRINDCVLSGPESCACGRGYPLIRQIVGRTTDVFRLPNGDIVPGVALTNRVLKVCPGLKKVQVVQETLKNFVVRYVPGPGFGQADLELLRANLHKFFSDSIVWTFEPVPDIPREPSGKTRFCISHIGKATARGPGEPGPGLTSQATSVKS